METELSDGEKLMNSLIPFAQQQLEKYGGFAPFAAMLTKDGEAHLGMAAPDKLENTEGVALSQESIDRIISAHRIEVEKDNLLASAICFDTSVSRDGKNKESAVAVAIEEENGKSVTVFIPYTKNFFGKIKYGDLFGSQKEKNIFINLN